MDIARIHELLVASLGDVDEHQQPVEGSEVVRGYLESFAYKTSMVEAHKDELAALLRDWPTESQGHPVPPLGDDITFVKAGAVLDSQQMALMLFGFGQVAGWWTVKDPHTELGLSYKDRKGAELASRGWVGISGYSPAASV